MNKLKQKLRIVTKRQHNKVRFKLTRVAFHLSPKILLFVGFYSNPSIWAHESRSSELHATDPSSTSEYPVSCLLNYPPSQQLKFSLIFSKLLGICSSSDNINHFHGSRYCFLNIHFNIIFPTTYMFSYFSLILNFATKILCAFSSTKEIK